MIKELQARNKQSRINLRRYLVIKSCELLRKSYLSVNEKSDLIFYLEKLNHLFSNLNLKIHKI